MNITAYASAASKIRIGTGTNSTNPWGMNIDNLEVAYTTSSSTPTVYNVSRSGSLISSFPFADIDPDAQSPQGVAYDQFSSTLWITDNSTDMVYNVTTSGTLISSFATDDLAGIENVQGITVESAGVLWLTARDTSTIYRVTNTGDQVLQTIPISQFAPTASDPTGVAFDPGIGVDVGAASEFAALWITDDVLKVTYQITPDGDLITSFATPNNATSSIVVDPNDRTLWGANEGSSSGTPPGKLVNYDRNGTVIEEIFAGEFGGVGTEGLAVAIAPDDDSLWVVDDPTIVGSEATVYNVSRSGSLISSFPFADIDPDAQSPQGVAYDQFSSTLWITDNSTDMVYNVTTSGTLISSFATDDLAGIENVQGITVESAGVLWLTARDTSTIYRVTNTGDQVLQTIPISQFAPTASNPTGVAFDPGIGVDVGAASDFAVLGLPGSTLKMKDVDVWTGLVGDVGLGPAATQDFDEGLLTGSYFVDPAGDNGNNHNVVISGGTVEANLATATDDALAASATAASLPADQVFGDIKNDTVITGGPGLNVIEVKKIELDNAETLTLEGDASSFFVINLSRKFKLKEASFIILSGGILPENVLFNLLGDEDSAIESGSVAYGRILAPYAKMKIKGVGSLLVGAIIGGKEIKFEDGGRLRTFDAELAPGSIGEAADAAAVALPGSIIKLKGENSTLFGDVLLGPLAEQDFDKGTIEGTYRVDPAADNGNSHDVIITGGTVIESVSRAVADAIDASYAAAGLTPDQTFGDIKNDTVITGGPGLNVIEIKKIELDNAETLTFVGDASSVFVVNVEDKLKLKEASSIVLSGGVLAENVLFNVLGDGDSVIESGSVAVGTILALYADKLKVKGAGTSLSGVLIGGHEIIIEKDATIVSP